MGEDFDSDLGEMFDEDIVEDRSEQSTTDDTISEDDPSFPIPEGDTPKRCKTCGNPLSAVSNVEGECPYCATKRLRRVERRLVELKQLKNERSYCTIEGHREVTSTPFFPEWDGKIVINGVDLFPVYPLCKSCIDQLTAYLVFYLEERGILRKGMGNSKNIFGDPINTPLTLAESKDAQKKLEAFLSNVNIYALDDKSPVNRVYTQLRDRRRAILSNRVKEAKKCLNENKTQQKSTQSQQDAKTLLNLAAKEGYPKKLSEETLQKLQMQALEILMELLKHDNDENPALPMLAMWTPFQAQELEERLQNQQIRERFTILKNILMTRIPSLQDLAVDFVDALLEDALDYGVSTLRAK